MIRELEGLFYKETFNLITETEDLCKCLRKPINIGMWLKKRGIYAELEKSN